MDHADYLVIVRIYGTSIEFRKYVRLWNPHLYYLNYAVPSIFRCIIILPSNKLLEKK